MLYQLSYTHHTPHPRPQLHERLRLGTKSGLHSRGKKLVSYDRAENGLHRLSADLLYVLDQMNIPHTGNVSLKEIWTDKITLAFLFTFCKFGLHFKYIFLKFYLYFLYVSSILPA